MAPRNSWYTGSQHPQEKHRRVQKSQERVFWRSRQQRSVQLQLLAEIWSSMSRMS